MSTCVPRVWGFKRGSNIMEVRSYGVIEWKSFNDLSLIKLRVKGRKLK